MAKSSGIPLPRNVKDIIGMRFTRWKVLSYAGTNKHRQSTWLCVCSCPAATTKIVSINQLQNGKSKSCGCLYRETRTTSARTHGGCYDPEYSSWHAMMNRCYHADHISYGRYGGAKSSVTVYLPWHDYPTFKREVGPRPSLAHSIDRFPNRDGNYEPGNVRWATKKEQARNRKTNRYITHDGKTLTWAEWTEIKGWHRSKIKGRKRAGWSDERTITTP